MHKPPTRTVAAAAIFLALALPSLAAELEWPGFRGPRHDGSGKGRLVDGDTAGLGVGWKRALGSGYSAVVVGDGKVLTMFADGADDVLGAFDAASGDELWRYRVGETYAGHSGSHDGPISTPVMSKDRVFGIGPRGRVFAVNAADGRQIWVKHLVDDFGAEAPHYGFTTSPVLAGGTLVVLAGAPEGRAVVGLNPDTGEVKWSLGEDGARYQSPIVARVGGAELVLAAGNEKLFGIDPAGGRELWSYEHGGDDRAMGGSTIVPVPAGDDRFFLMNKVDASTMLKITAGKQMSYDVDVLWSDRSISKSYVTPVYHDGYLYGISGRILTCVDAETGETVWRSREPGDGFLTLVGNKLVVMTKPGRMHLAAVSPRGYSELASLDLFDEHSWSEAAIAGNSLYVRSMGHLARVDVTSNNAVVEAANAWLVSTDFGGFLDEVRRAPDKKRAVDAFLSRQDRFPIVEGSDIVHFVYRGEAEDVGIVGDMIGFRREDPMQRVDGTDLFYYSMRLEPDAAVTYGFIKDYGEPTADPLNPESADGLFGEVSLLAMPAWREAEHIAEAPESRRGRLESVAWEREVTEKEGDEEKIVVQKRTAQVYLPAGFDPGSDRRYPTLYVHNGKSSLDKGLMKQSLDNLIGERIQPVIAVFLMPRDGEKGDDIGRLDAQNEMLVNELVPLIDERYPTLAGAKHRAVIGVDNGGTVAVVGALKHPEVFGRVGSQSAVFFGVSVADVLAETETRAPLAIYMSWGTYDLRSPHEAWDMARNNREAWAALRAAGQRPAGGEVPEGNGWRCWRGHTDEMLAALFPLRGPA